MFTKRMIIEQYEKEYNNAVAKEQQENDAKEQKLRNILKTNLNNCLKASKFEYEYKGGSRYFLNTDDQSPCNELITAINEYSADQHVSLTEHLGGTKGTLPRVEYEKVPHTSYKDTIKFREFPN